MQISSVDVKDDFITLEYYGVSEEEGHLLNLLRLNQTPFDFSTLLNGLNIKHLVDTGNYTIHSISNYPEMVRGCLETKTVIHLHRPIVFSS